MIKDAGIFIVVFIGFAFIFMLAAIILKIIQNVIKYNFYKLRGGLHFREYKKEKAKIRREFRKQLKEIKNAQTSGKKTNTKKGNESSGASNQQKTA